MFAKITAALALFLLSRTAAPAELAVDMQMQTTKPPGAELRAELRADVVPRGYWVGPEI